MYLRELVKDTWFWNFINSKRGKCIKFVVLLFLGMFNLGVDWYFYAKLLLTEPGLVYGPSNNSVKSATLAFCIISVFGFIIETIQNIDDLLLNGKLPFLTQSLTNFLVIFFEDIPLLIINLVVTVCNDGEPTVISVVKASVGIATTILRLILVLLIYWLFEKKKSRFNLITDLFSTIGLLTIAGISIAIQLLNTYPTNSNGLIQTSDPTSFNEIKYVKDKYLNNVGIYVSWPIDQNSNSYLLLANVNDVIDSSSVNVQIRTDLDLSTYSVQNYSLCLTKKAVKTCFAMTTSGYATQVDPASLTSVFLNNNGYELDVSKQPAQQYKYKIGYLDYKVNKLVYDKTTSKANCMRAQAYSIIFAKYASSLSGNVSYLKSTGNMGYSLYSYDSDLIRVDKFWRTGITGCPMSGDLGPKYNSEMGLIC